MCFRLFTAAYHLIYWLGLCICIVSNDATTVFRYLQCVQSHSAAAKTDFKYAAFSKTHLTMAVLKRKAILAINQKSVYIVKSAQLATLLVSAQLVTKSSFLAKQHLAYRQYINNNWQFVKNSTTSVQKFNADNCKYEWAPIQYTSDYSSKNNLHRALSNFNFCASENITVVNVIISLRNFLQKKMIDPVPFWQTRLII